MARIYLVSWQSHIGFFNLMEKASKLPKLKGAEASVFSRLESLGSSETHTNVSVFCSVCFGGATLGLCFCMWAFSSYGDWGYSLAAVHRLLSVVVSPVAEHGL